MTEPEAYCTRQKFDILPIQDPRNTRKTVWIMRHEGEEIVGENGRRFYRTARGARMALDDHISRQSTMIDPIDVEGLKRVLRGRDDNG
jgi:hypothetical protein